MARRLHNWNYNGVTDFLRHHGFSFYEELGGSHETWIKRGLTSESDRIVGLHFTHRSYTVKAMKRIIKASGIAEEVWIKWNDS